MVQTIANNNLGDATLEDVEKGRQAELRSGVLACISVLSMFGT